jgi:DNA repair photolyase
MGKITKATGNMYSWCTHVWNPFKSYKCEYECTYCYLTAIANRYGQNLSNITELDLPFHQSSKNIKTIFLGHCSDIFANQVTDAQLQILFYSLDATQNYVIQSKNPKRMYGFIVTERNFNFNNFTFGTTIECDKQEIIEKYSKAPRVSERFEYIKKIKELGFKTFITIEPIMRFSENFYELLIKSNVDFINIGSDSKQVIRYFDEPTKEMIKELIDKLKESNIEIKIKSNLKI